jgi:hypothetical protein
VTEASLARRGPAIHRDPEPARAQPGESRANGVDTARAYEAGSRRPLASSSVGRIRHDLGAPAMTGDVAGRLLLGRATRA